jgi:hypothetical protein
MAVLAFTSAKGAPGVTTTVLALAFAWYRPVLVVEADMTGSSSMLAGLLRGETDHSRGVVPLSVGSRQQGFTLDGLWEHCLRLNEDRYLLPGIADPGQASTLTSAWAPLAQLFAGLEADGVDVLVDAGRLGTTCPPASLLAAADSVLLVTGTRLPDVYALSRRAPAIRAELGGAEADSIFVLTVGEGRPYSNREIASSLGLPVISSIAWDPVSAEVYSVGAPPGRRFESSALVRTATATVKRLGQAVSERRMRLAPVLGSSAREEPDV